MARRLEVWRTYLGATMSIDVRIDELLQIYKSGRAAFAAGEALADNPTERPAHNVRNLPALHNHLSWRDGWLDEYRAQGIAAFLSDVELKGDTA